MKAKRKSIFQTILKSLTKITYRPKKNGTVIKYELWKKGVRVVDVELNGFDVFDAVSNFFKGIIKIKGGKKVMDKFKEQEELKKVTEINCVKCNSKDISVYPTKKPEKLLFYCNNCGAFEEIDKAEYDKFMKKKEG